jgi:hypothetical protein
VIGGTIEGLHLSKADRRSPPPNCATALWHYGVLFAREQHLTSGTEEDRLLLR